VAGIGRLGLGRLPGDIFIQREGFTFYAPIQPFRHPHDGIVMSGRAPADQGLFFGVARVVGAVMSSASHEGSSVNSFLPMAIRGELSFPQGIPC
jgi:hypothetical protein